MRKRQRVASEDGDGESRGDGSVRPVGMACIITCAPLRGSCAADHWAAMHALTGSDACQPSTVGIHNLLLPLLLLLPATFPALINWERSHFGSRPRLVKT